MGIDGYDQGRCRSIHQCCHRDELVEGEGAVRDSPDWVGRRSQ